MTNCTHCGDEIAPKQPRIETEDGKTYCGPRCDYTDNHRCSECNGFGGMSTYCGVWVCDECNHHDGLARCYCGWSVTSPGRGYQELEEMGERIEEE
jgi:hypothetical protein